MSAALEAPPLERIPLPDVYETPWLEYFDPHADTEVTSGSFFAEDAL